MLFCLIRRKLKASILMDPWFSQFKFKDDSFFNRSEKGSKHDYLELDALDIPLPSTTDNFPPSSTEADSPDSDPVLRFLNQILLEEDLEEKPSMFHDPLALRAAEKSLYDVIGQKYRPSPYTSTCNVGTGCNTDPQWIVDPGENILLEFDAVNNSFYSNGNIQNLFTDSESVLQFKRGMEEASRFLPSSNQLTIDLDRYELPQKPEDVTPPVVIEAQKRKHQHLDNGDLVDMERSSKQFAMNIEDVQLSEMFDRVLLYTDDKDECGNNGTQFQCSAALPEMVPKESNRRRNRAKKNEMEGDSVDLRTLLISCAQSVAADDRKTAYEQLKQIMQHSSQTGDVNQRLAYVFATGLEARLCGTGTEVYASLTRRKITAAEKLKAFQVYLKASPFKKLSIAFANKMIASVASEATALHIIDFGIIYGFQWPILIRHLSQRANGPLKLKITGIELPQPGFRPAERVEETGRRLAKYCERFGVPFQYQAIATQNWETIKIKDLKIESGEVLAVNSLFQFNRLLDETVMVDSQRDAVLNLIRKMKPDIFVNAVTNGCFNTPFFVTRFREALFHYSALFDMFDATLDRENPQRIDFEQDFYGREVINVVGCEGGERVERPETYKQWQVRHIRAGFKAVPLDDGILKKYRQKGSAYHSDFLYDEDGCWFLQGWKGRVICASSCWVPA